MGDVFDDLNSLVEDHAQMRRAFTLSKGELYEVEKFEIQERTATAYRSVKAFITEEGLKFFVYLPKKFSNMTTAQVDALNDKIAAQQPPSICYYGTLEKATIVEIHRFGEAPKQSQLERIAKLEKLMENNDTYFKTPDVSPLSSPSKRSSDAVEENGANPEKKGRFVPAEKKSGSDGAGPSFM